MAPGAQATGLVDGQAVVVLDPAQAQRLAHKAQAGELRDGALRLSLVEAAHCVTSGWLAVPGRGDDGPAALGAADLVALADDPRRALTDYLVYRDLRSRGLVARHAPGRSHFDVWPRGMSTGPLLFQNVCCSVRDPATTADLLDGAQAPGIVCSVVDEDSVVTHYRLGFEEPKGDVPPAPLPPAPGHRVADRVLVTDAAAVAAYAKEHLGTPAGTGLFLSPLEAEALRRRGMLHIDPAPGGPALEQVQAYEALRAAGVVAKSGFRFGAHLRGYVGAPDDEHAHWLLHCARPGELLPWSALSRGVRLAHGVRKRFLVAIPDGAAVRFVRIDWLRV